MKAYLLAMPFALLCGAGASVRAEVPPQRGFVSAKPAETWEQALVSGNGTYGALVMGQALDETIILNHARLFMPLNPPLPPVDTASHLQELRALNAAGQYQRAADRVVELSKTENFGGKRWTDPFVPAFDLRVRMVSKGEVKDYRRSVDFQSGVASVRWRDDRGAYGRRLFVSRPDDVVVLSIAGPAVGMVDCDLQLAQRPTQGTGGWNPENMFKIGIKDVAIAAEEGWLSYRSSFKRQWPGSLQGYEGGARVVAKGGQAVVEGQQIKIRGADEVLVLIRIGLLKDFNLSRLTELKQGLSAVGPDYDALLSRHAKAHGGLFNRMRLDLGGSAAEHALTSEELIAASRVGKLSSALLEKEFDACRYVIISSSGELFPNLQGIWNGTWSPPWSSDFTMNGNVQSAIAANLSANLAECLEPYFRYLEAQMADCRENARRLYGCRGIHVASRVSSHGLNNHFDGTWPMTFWTAGAGWHAQFFYDYYLYTGDRGFLQKRALPFMREAALFYEDFLVEGPDGKLLFSPSYSPENNPKNDPSQACVNATMDIAVARELLTHLIAACGELGTDAEGVKRWRALLAKMPDYLINADGAVKEWTTPLLEDNYAHRHVSHLYPLFVGLPPEIGTNAALRAAFKRAADYRMEIRRKENGGEMAFGL
ncbi:MAG: glycoside hydrolase N-terminal domain-containing protein, partial [bacterium]